MSAFLLNAGAVVFIIPPFAIQADVNHRIHTQNMVGIGMWLESTHLVLEIKC